MPITPEYLTYQLNTLTVQRQLEQAILDDIVRRIVKTDFTITDTADWETEKLQQCGVLYRDIVKEIAKKTGKMESEICAIYEDAGTKVFQYDYDGEISDVIKQARAPMSEAMRKIWDASLKKTSTEAVNLTKTMANTSQAAYINACDLAYMKVASGAFSYQTAIRDAVLDIAGKGAWITYPSGHRSAVDAAVRRAVLTGVNQTAGQLQIMRADEIDCDLMEISAHAGARPSHAEWQGQIVSRSGKRGYLSLDDIGYGRADGFMGVNCRHNWYMYFEGNERVYTQSRLDEYKNHTVNYNGETLTDYEASQKQRSMERAVRKQKQKLVCTNTAIKETDDDLLKAELKADFERRSVKLKQREGKLADFCTQTGRREDTFRTQVYGFNRSVSGKAVWSNKRVANSGNGGIINYAKVDNLFSYNADDVVRITPQDILDDLSTSKIGRETLEYLENLPQMPKLNYIDALSGIRAEEREGVIVVYVKNCKDVKTAACSLIHECTHRKYGIGQSQWAESQCVSAEILHRRNRDYLTMSEKRMIVKAVKDVYPEYNWRKGGTVRGRKK